MSLASFKQTIVDAGTQAVASGGTGMQQLMQMSW
jgi:hypothetical protein